MKAAETNYSSLISRRFINVQVLCFCNVRFLLLATFSRRYIAVMVSWNRIDCCAIGITCPEVFCLGSVYGRNEYQGYKYFTLFYSAFKTFTGSTCPARIVWDRTVSSPTMATKTKPMLVFIKLKST